MLIESLSVSSIYILLHTCLMIGQAYWVVIQRRRENIGLGHADKPALAMAMASHANATENIPLALLILVVTELNGGNQWILHIAGSLLFTGRVIHALGTARNPARSFGRYWGTLITWLMMLTLSCYSVVLLYL